MGVYIHKASDYLFYRVDGAAGPAKSISFDPTISDLDADNVQDAVDEVVEILDGKQDALTNPLTQSDVVNNLTSTATNVPLSAAQGKALNDSKLRISGRANSNYSEIMGRTNEDIVSLNIYDVNRSGLSVDFNYASSAITIFKVVNGVAVGQKLVFLQ